MRRPLTRRSRIRAALRFPRAVPAPAVAMMVAMMASPSAAAPRETWSGTMPALTRLDTLFITASTGEPRFQAARDSAQAELLAGDSLTLAWLVERAMRPGHRLTPRQSHYIERLFTLIADSGRHDAPRVTLARAIATAPHDTARARWLYIGSRLGDTAFRAVAQPWLRDSSATVRRMAVRVLGAYPHPDHLPQLWDSLEHVHGLERHMRLWALGEHPSLLSTPAARATVLARLAPLLEDPHLYNRRKIRDIMLKAADGFWAPLHRVMPENPDLPLRREWWRLAREARGGGPFLKAAVATMTEEERRVLGL